MVRHGSSMASVPANQRCLSDSAKELVKLRAFVQERCCAFVEIPLAIGWTRVVAKDYKGNVWCHRVNRTQHLQAGTAVKLDVKHHHVRVSCQDTFDRALRGLGMADHSDTFAIKQSHQPVTDQDRVVGMENSDGWRGLLKHASTVAASAFADHRC